MTTQPIFTFMYDHIMFIIVITRYSRNKMSSFGANFLSNDSLLKEGF